MVAIEFEDYKDFAYIGDIHDQNPEKITL